MKHRDEIYIAVMTLVFCCAMFAVYAIVPKDAAVAAKAKATITEAPETAAEAEALRSSQAEEAGFTIYTEDSNYDYDDTDVSDTDSTYDDTYADSDYTYTPDSSDSSVADEGNFDQSDYNPSDQITYPDEDDSWSEPSQDDSFNTDEDWSDWNTDDNYSDDSWNDTSSGDYADEGTYTE